MRPPLLNPLFAGAAGLKGIGAKLDKLLASFLRPAHGTPGDTTRIVDLLFHLPSGIVDRRFRPKIHSLPRDGVVTVEATVMRHRPPPPGNKRVPYRVDVSDGTGPLTLVFFHAYADSIRRMLPEGETRFISGKIDWFNDEPQMAHPTCPSCSGMAGRASAPRCGHSTTPRHPPPSARKARPAAGWPMTSCWRTNSPSRWCAPT